MVELFLLLSRNGVTYRRVEQLTAITTVQHKIQMNAFLKSFKETVGDGIVSLNFSPRIEGMDKMLHSTCGNLENIIDV